MSYLDAARQVGDSVITLVEIDIDMCANSFGLAPCTATADPGSECYNSFETCQDKDNYAAVTTTLRFSGRDDPPLKGFAGVPALISAEVAPTIVEPEKGLGPRGSVRIKLADFVHPDAGGIDPYRDTRLYDPAQGSFWGKLKARQGGSLYGRPLRVLRGFRGDGFDAANFQAHLYFIEEVDGPDSRGQVSIKAVDPLKRLHDTKLPAPSRLKLTAAVAEADTALTLQDEDGELTGQTDGVIRIGSELISWADQDDTNAPVIVLQDLTRGAHGSDVSSHDADDAAQPCYVVTDELVKPVLADMITRAGLDAYIPTAQWDVEASRWLRSAFVSNVVSKPTPVQKLVASLAFENGLFIWWDERLQQIPLKVLAPPIFDDVIKRLDDSTAIIDGSFDQEDRWRDQVTRLSIYYDPLNRIETTKAEHFAKRALSINAEVEDPRSFGRVKEREIFAQWITARGRLRRLSLILLSRLVRGDQRVKFAVDAKDADTYPGDVVTLVSDRRQDVTGAAKVEDFRIIRARDRDDGRIEFEAISALFQVGSNTNLKFWIWQPAAVTNDYDNATDDEKKRAFWADATGKLSDGSDGYLWF